ncbi:MAG: hypothetical protein IPP66_05475 [Anaerolineales bacterium]|nr:hypothetical protein [Anaerolineales bacterium]
MSKILRKILQITLYVTLFLVFIFIVGSSQKYVRRLFHQPLTNISVENPNSALLSMLINKSKFSGDWWWNIITTHQGDHPQYNANINEFAIRFLVGYYRGHDVRFTHTLNKYITASNEINTDPMWTSIGVSNPVDQVLIPIPESSTFLDPVCYIGIDKADRRTTRCVLIREDRNIQERIELDIYGETSVEVMSPLVNNIVMFFDEKESIIK